MKEFVDKMYRQTHQNEDVSHAQKLIALSILPIPVMTIIVFLLY